MNIMNYVFLVIWKTDGRVAIMMLLNVPYSEKDMAKQLGAKWNPNLKKWYVQERENYYKFLNWILDGKQNGDIEILCDCFYIVEGVRECFKCHNKTRVVGFAVEKHMSLNYECYYDETGVFVSGY